MASTPRHPSSGRGRYKNTKEDFDWIVQSMDLILQLMPVLSETNKAWEDFISSGGDISYLQNTSYSQRSQQAFESIFQTFESLKVLQRRLHTLNERCRGAADNVGTQNSLL
jgi:hypothetical protein